MTIIRIIIITIVIITTITVIIIIISINIIIISITIVIIITTIIVIISRASPRAAGPLATRIHKISVKSSRLLWGSLGASWGPH